MSAIQRGGGNVPSQLDMATHVSGRGPDHGELAKESLHEAGESAKEIFTSLAAGLSGTNLLADGDDTKVDGVGMYVFNLGVSTITAASMPAVDLKELAEAAVHGIKAGFQKSE